MTRGVLIRRFRRADLPRILEIESEAFQRDAYPSEVFRELYAECPGLFLVAQRSGRIAGYMVTCVHPRKAEIVSIAVDSKHRNQGIGRALMVHTLAALRALGVRRVQLMVRPSNRAAVRFYRGFGFIRQGRIAGYYPGRGDALEMQLRLA